MLNYYPLVNPYADCGSGFVEFAYEGGFDRGAKAAEAGRLRQPSLNALGLMARGADRAERQGYNAGYDSMREVQETPFEDSQHFVVSAEGKDPR